jgi:hypothetical protein
MYVCMYVWLYGCMYVWLYGCMAVCALPSFLPEVADWAVHRARPVWYGALTHVVMCCTSVTPSHPLTHCCNTYLTLTKPPSLLLRSFEQVEPGRRVQEVAGRVHHLVGALTRSLLAAAAGGDQQQEGAGCLAVCQAVQVGTPSFLPEWSFICAVVETPSQLTSQSGSWWSPCVLS